VELKGEREVKMNGHTRPNERPAEKKNKSGRHPSNIIFNLIALALLLTVIVFLHQILRKPKASEPGDVKAVAALPATAAAVTLPPVQIPVAAPAPASQAEAKTEAPAKVELPEEKVQIVELPTKEPEARPVVIRTSKKNATTKTNSWSTEQEISAPELDGEEARQKYIDENRHLSSGKVKTEKSPTRAAPRPAYQASSASTELDREAGHRFEGRSSSDLDDETARQKYLEENRRVSKAGGTSRSPTQHAAPKPASTGGDEYIPFENR
jgi:hypothetical protein